MSQALVAAIVVSCGRVVGSDRDDHGQPASGGRLGTAAISQRNQAHGNESEHRISGTRALATHRLKSQ
jgi:hypothetical protein